METALLTSLAERDRQVVWHPFVQAKLASAPLTIVRGEGAYLFDENGNRYIDAVSSWWVNLHGHAHPYIAGKISDQLGRLEHVIFTDFTHSPGVELAERLLAMIPGNLSKVFYTDNGSTAVEAALKMALQYWVNKDPNTPKKTVIAFRNGYHGDTFGAMAVGGKTHFNRPFWPYLFHVETIDPPFPGQERESLRQLADLLEKEDVACFIFEPLIQGAGGMRMYSSEALDPLLQLCQVHDVITIADEVMTGFGRTGPLFACETLTHLPELLCLSKGITGGFLPLGATLCSQRIYDAFYAQERAKTFLHGHSYTGNPLACTAALASLDLLQKEESNQQRTRIAKQHDGFVKQFKDHPRLIRCESKGTVLAVEYREEQESSYYSPLNDRLKSYFLSKGVIVRPLGNILYILPPYCIDEQDLEKIYFHIQKTLQDSWNNF